MSKFQTITLGEAKEIIIDYRGKTPIKSEEGIRLITAKVVKNGVIIDERAEYVARDYFDTWMTRGMPQENDIVMTTEAPLGEVAILGLKKYALGQRIITIRVNPLKMNAQYMYFAMQSEYVQDQLLKRATGTTVLGIKQTELLKVPIPYYHLEIQVKIANILKAYTTLIENNNRRIAILEEMAQKLYREWFVHFRFPGHEKVEMVESEMGLIPEGWKVTPLKELCNRIFSGGTPTTTIDEYWNGELPWLSSGETRDGYITSTEKAITKAGAKNSSTRFANKFNVVVASAGQGKTRGQTSLLLLDTYINQSVIAIEALESYQTYIYFNIKGRYDELRHFSDSSSIRGSLTVQIFNSLQILAPSENVVKQFQKVALSFIIQIETLLTKNTNLRKTRDLLLPRLISGDIDVSELDIPIKEG